MPQGEHNASSLARAFRYSPVAIQPNSRSSGQRSRSCRTIGHFPRSALVSFTPTNSKPSVCSERNAPNGSMKCFRSYEGSGARKWSTTTASSSTTQRYASNRSQRNRSMSGLAERRQANFVASGDSATDGSPASQRHRNAPNLVSQFKLQQAALAERSTQSTTAQWCSTLAIRFRQRWRISSRSATPTSTRTNSFRAAGTQCAPWLRHLLPSISPRSCSSRSQPSTIGITNSRTLARHCSISKRSGQSFSYTQPESFDIKNRWRAPGTSSSSTFSYATSPS